MNNLMKYKLFRVNFSQYNAIYILILFIENRGRLINHAKFVYMDENVVSQTFNLKHPPTLLGNQVNVDTVTISSTHQPHTLIRNST